MGSSENPDALRQIAHALGLPVSAFRDPRAARSINPAAQAARESSELLEAFARIADPAIRCECIAFVRAKARCL